MRFLLKHSTLLCVKAPEERTAGLGADGMDLCSLYMLIHQLSAFSTCMCSRGEHYSHFFAKRLCSS